jgi:hypothetical protein
MDLKKAYDSVHWDFILGIWKVRRWQKGKTQVAQVQKRTSEEDQIPMILKSLSPEYTNWYKLTHHPSIRRVCVGCQIEDALAAGPSPPSAPRRNYEITPTRNKYWSGEEYQTEGCFTVLTYHIEVVSGTIQTIRLVE